MYQYSTSFYGPVIFDTTILCFIHPFIIWWTFGFLLISMNIAAVNIVNMLLHGHMFSFLRDICLGIKLLDYMVTLWLLLKEFPELFQSGCAILCSHQQNVEVLISPHFRNACLLFCFNCSLPSEYKVLSHVALICISLTTSDIEHIFTCVLATCVSFWSSVYSGPWHIFFSVAFNSLVSCVMFHSYRNDW